MNMRIAASCSAGRGRPRPQSISVPSYKTAPVSRGSSLSGDDKKKTTQYRGGLCPQPILIPHSRHPRVHELEPFRAEQDEEMGETSQRISLYDSHDISVSRCIHRRAGFQ
jgi:hypothetical protein